MKMSSQKVQPKDQTARVNAVENIGTSTFISAGAGGGKSTTIVNRLVHALLHDKRELDLENIAAITFTERAGSELRERVRNQLESLNTEQPSEKLQKAIVSVDSATIGTIHSFALDILSKYPVQAGLPLEFEILDDSTSKRMVQELSREVLEGFVETYVPNDKAAAFKQQLTIEHLQKLVAAVYNMQHRLNSEVFGPVSLEDPEIEIRKLVPIISDLRASSLYDSAVLTKTYFDALEEGFLSFDALIAAGDFSPLSVEAFKEACKKIATKGKGNANASFRQLVEESALDLDLFTRLLGVDTELLARELLYFAWISVSKNLDDRCRSGHISFDDLLYLAVKVLSEHRDVREAIYEQYKLLIIDEFQDTDPLQWELALLVTTNPTKSVADPDPGSLVLVGDSQQSIYAFRGADLATFEQAQHQFESDFTKTQSPTLEVNFRSTDAILDWVNACFAPLDMGADFAPLAPAHENTVGNKFGPAVHVLQGKEGSVLEGKDEPYSVASTIRTAIADKWQVREGKHANEGTRDVQFKDISLLIPTRTTLNKLLTALEDHQVPYRSNDARIVYDRPIVLGLLGALRAISGYGVPLDIWAALKSPLFGCTDTELLVYKKAGGSWRLPFGSSPIEQEGPVAEALATLGRVRDANHASQPSQVFYDLVVACDIASTYHQVLRGEFELDCVDMVIQHARKWEQAGGAGLVDYSNWIAETLEDNSRERLPEIDDADDSAVRISTVHAVKGLEFPMVVVAGLGVDRQIKPPTLAINGSQVEYYLSSELMSAGYGKDLLAGEIGKINQEHLRVLYVAATRAKDHLVISGARKINEGGPSEKDWGFLLAESLNSTISGGLAVSADTILPPIDASWSQTASVEPLSPEWLKKLEAARAAANKRFVTKPSQLHEKTHASYPPVVLVDDQSVSDNASDDEQDIQGADVKDVGTQFHAIMEQVVKYRIDLRPDVLAEEITLAAKRINMPEHEGRIADLVKSAIASDYMQRVFKADRVWPELSMLASDGSLEDGIIEGFADLVFQDSEGLVVLDYKTNIALTPQKIADYRLQLDVYANLITKATGLEVNEKVLLHVTTKGTTAHKL
jgi:ATP-dependent helicase/nuclease subunit A